MNRKTQIIAAAAVAAFTIAGALTMQPTENEQKNEFQNLVGWYYSLPKVVPGTNGQEPQIGYSGPVVRWDGAREVWPKDLPTEYTKKLKAKSLKNPKAIGEYDDKLERL